MFVSCCKKQLYLTSSKEAPQKQSVRIIAYNKPVYGRYENSDNADCRKKHVFFAIILTFVLMMKSVLNSLGSKNPLLETTLLRLRTSFSLLIYPELYDGKGANCSRKFSRGCLLLLQSSSCSQKYIIPLLSQI